jgi:hypothetical protein
MGASDPPYNGFCSGDTGAPTCSVFLPPNTYLNNDPPCSGPWYNADFPPPDASHRSIIYDVMLPAALGVTSCNLSEILVWAHFNAIGEVSRNCTIQLWFNYLGSSTPVAQNGWLIGDVYAEEIQPLTADDTWITTTEEPTHLQIKLVNLYFPGSDTIAFDWGASIWSNEWCGVTPPLTAIPARLATIVG